MRRDNLSESSKLAEGRRCRAGNMQCPDGLEQTGGMHTSASWLESSQLMVSSTALVMVSLSEGSSLLATCKSTDSQCQQQQQNIESPRT